MIVVASSRSLPAVHQEQFYVSISRGRERCQVFTDDKDLLRAQVTRSSARVAAVEVLLSASIQRHTLLRRVLQWAERVGELVRLNVTMSAQRNSQQNSSRESIQTYEQKRIRISVG